MAGRPLRRARMNASRALRNPWKQVGGPFKTAQRLLAFLREVGIFRSELDQPEMDKMLGSLRAGKTYTEGDWDEPDNETEANFDPSWRVRMTPAGAMVEEYELSYYESQALSAGERD